MEAIQLSPIRNDHVNNREAVYTTANSLGLDSVQTELKPSMRRDSKILIALLTLSGLVIVGLTIAVIILAVGSRKSDERAIYLDTPAEKIDKLMRRIPQLDSAMGYGSQEYLQNYSKAAHCDSSVACRAKESNHEPDTLFPLPCDNEKDLKTQLKEISGFVKFNAARPNPDESLTSYLSRLNGQFDLNFPFRLNKVKGTDSGTTIEIAISDGILPWDAWESIDDLSKPVRDEIFKLLGTTVEEVGIERQLLDQATLYKNGGVDISYNEINDLWSLPGVWDWGDYLDGLGVNSTLGEIKFRFKSNPMAIIMSLTDLWENENDNENLVNYLMVRVCRKFLAYVKRQNAMRVCGGSFNTNDNLGGMELNSRQSTELLKSVFELLREELKMTINGMPSINGSVIFQAIDSVALVDSERHKSLHNPTNCFDALRVSSSSPYLENIAALLKWRASEGVNGKCLEQFNSVEQKTKPFLFFKNGTSNFLIFTNVGSQLFHNVTDYGQLFAIGGFQLMEGLIDALENILKINYPGMKVFPPTSNAWLTNCLNQNYGIKIVDEENYYLNTVKTMGSNFKQLLSLQVVYNAYSNYYRWLGTTRDSMQFTPEENFLLRFESQACNGNVGSQTIAEQLLNQMQSNTLLPPKSFTYILNNFAPFSDVFECSPEKMPCSVLFELK